MFNLNNKKGIALILVILLMTTILFLASYFLTFSITENKISRSQSWGAKTYHLAEAGIQEMVWRLKNDAAYKNSFETDPNWTVTFTRNNPFGTKSGSYTVTITNSALAHGEIVSTGSIQLEPGKSTQRIVKTYVYRAMGEGTDLGDNCGYADGNIDISFSKVNFHGGSAHSNNNFIINGLSTVNIDNDLNAVNNYNKSGLSTVNVGGDIYAANYPPAASEIDMPAVDFNSADPDSMKNQADVIYTENQFENLLNNNQNLVLNDPITYVEGDVDVNGDTSLTVNGLLVVERDFNIGKKYCLGWFWRCGRSFLTVNHATGTPSGILAKRKVNFSTWIGNININGVVYANDTINLLSFPGSYTYNLNGGAVGRKLTITSVWHDIDITRNDEIINSTLGAPEFSPVITVEHWEEEY